MTAGQINRELDRLERSFSSLTDRFISHGWGQEKLQSILARDHPDASKGRGIVAREHELHLEIARRYGPGAPHHLPSGRGFGPRSNPLQLLTVPGRLGITRPGILTRKFV